MDESWRQMIEQIHGSGRHVVLAVTGGGSGAIARLLEVPGGSRTLLEAIVPYDERALAQFLYRQPEHACSDETAVLMARRARDRARELAPDSSACVGVGATASLVSDRPKKGDHRCHIATASDSGVRVASLVLEKGRRDRAGEEDVVARAIMVMLATACDVLSPGVATLISAGDRLTESDMPRNDLLARLIRGEINRLTVHPDGQIVVDAPTPRGILPGSFNPLHAGHLELARVASELLAAPVAFELSISNVDKPPLAASDVRNRLGQFTGHSRVELTRAPTFLEKSRLFPGATFVVGTDTAVRIIDPKYYSNSEPAMLAALSEIGSHACRFLVAGRTAAAGEFVSLADLAIPTSHQQLFTAIPAERFRSDLSSTSLRGHPGAR